MAFTYREGLDRPLTWQEMDGNLEYVEALAQQSEAMADSAGTSAAQAATSVGLAADQAALAADQAQLAEGYEEQAQIYAAAAQSAAGVPSLAGNAGKVLGIQQDEQGVEWQELPVANINDIEGISESGLLLATGDTIADDNGILHSGSSIPEGRQSVTEGNWYLGTDKQHTAAGGGTVVLDLALASIFDLTLTGNTTLTVSNASVPSGETRSIVVRVRQEATERTVTWWAGITWLAPTTPAAPSANKIKEYVLSFDGSSWLGREGASN